jgi:hypothetical protein
MGEENDARHSFIRSPSQVQSNPVTISKNIAVVDFSFVSPIAVKGVRTGLPGVRNRESSPRRRKESKQFFSQLKLNFMAHADNSIITGKFKGTLGKQLVFRQWEGKTIVAKSPKPRTGDPSDAQAETQDKFQVASRYAKAITTNADQSMAQAYANALRPRQNIYSRAVEDFMSSPVVKLIDARSYQGNVGDKIVIRAVDDFRVTQVRVEIYAANGSLLEAGNATQNVNGIDWTYAASRANNPRAGTRINAIATDVPGNEGMLEVTV